MSLRNAFEQQRDRFLGEDEIAYRFSRATELLRGTPDEVALGLALAKETLVYDPYNVAMHRALAGVDDEDARYEHLCVCVDVGALDVSAMVEDRELLTELAKGRRDRSRFKDVCFDEIAPRANTFETTLRWPAERREDVVAAFERLVARVQAQLGRKDIGVVNDDLDRIESPFRLDDHLIGTNAHFGHVHQFFREIAPHVEDVRFLMFDQVSPVDEIWIVDGAFHLRRHPIFDSDAEQRARFFEDVRAQECADEPGLRAYLAALWSTVAHVDLEANENRRGHADGVAAGAAYAIERLLALGEKPDFFQARLHLFRAEGDVAAGHLERAIEARPTHREAVLMLARQRLAERRFEEAIRHADRAHALVPEYRDDVHLVRGIALESMGRLEEAGAAYLHHAKLRRDASGVVLRDAHALFARGLYRSAALVYEQLLEAPSSTGLDAELGLARCAEARGELATARRHYERVLARSGERRTKYADSSGILAELGRIEAQARAAMS